MRSLNPRNYLKGLCGAAIFLALLVAAGCLLLPRGWLRVAVSDIGGGLMMLTALVAFVTLGVASKGRMRWFSFLQAAGWALWFSDQMVWVTYDLIFHQKMPSMHPADALLFSAGAPMMAGLLLRPHRESTVRNTRLGALDFLLLLLWWIYLYVSLVMCWQYVVINNAGYDRNFDILSTTENVLLALILSVSVFQTSGKWRVFYGAFLIAVIFNAVWFYLLNRALEQGSYFTGSWWDIPYTGSFGLYVLTAFIGLGLTPQVETSAEDTYHAWMADLAMMGVLSLPIFAIYAVLDSNLPQPAVRFRVLLTLAFVFVMAFVIFIQHRRLNRELLRTNVVLQEASLTDPLTGLRNRRFFTATIDGDVGQTLRSYIDGHDSHTRDLVFYLIDADNFKEVNDRYGHDVGDRVLIEMSRRLSSSIRHSDVLVRWGGEEFLIVSRYTDRAEAELLAQRVLSAVADTPFSISESGEKMFRTCSLGWAAFPWYPENCRAVSYEEVLTLADRGLHRAKEGGKNRAVGMLPARGKTPATSVSGVHASTLQVDLLAITGPEPQT